MDFYIAYIVLKKVYNGSFGFNKLYDIASIPLIILVLNFYMFFASFIVNANSRYMERKTDAFQIELTKNKDAASPLC